MRDANERAKKKVEAEATAKAKTADAVTKPVEAGAPAPTGGHQ